MHFTVVHGNPLRADDIAQERDLCLVELTFLYLGVQLVFDEPLECCPDVFNMGFKGVRVYQYIVNVNDDELVQHVPENVIDECLEHRRTVG